MSKTPPFRKLRGYAFDPSMSLQLETASINEITYKISWEHDLLEGPEGEYVRVIDRDPASNATYKPVDLNEKEILANEGLEPSESNPQFHQQMVYAVAMNTIKNFERSIGRKVQWSPVTEDVSHYIKTKRIDPKKPVHIRRYVKQLILYPHGFRGANAYYSPDRKAILFGYFDASPISDDMLMPGSIIFTCLSHDIIAHEVTHAILDGMFNHYLEPTHPDVAAFHEAFSDIVALFQHFTFADVINHEIAKIKGRFDAENLLGKLAVEFGKASGNHGSLRDAIGKIENDKIWKRIKPNTTDYRTIFECHDRGAILVAAVFDAFIEIYNQRSSEVIRVATGGTGLLPAGELSTPLVKSLASEASKAASHVLSMCIRALDYCPPVDLTYGDYLRALITADAELVPEDKHNYRVAFIDAFRKRGIYPEGISSISVESLTLSAEEDSEVFEEFANSLSDFLQEFKNEMSYIDDRRNIFLRTRRFIDGNKGFSIDTERRTGLYEYFIKAITDYKTALLFERLTGLVFSNNYKKLHIHDSYRHKGLPSLNIHDLRLNNRVSPDGEIQSEVIILLSQSCGVKVIHNEIANEYSLKTFLHNPVDEFGEGAFLFRGGCTLVFDLNTSNQKNKKTEEPIARLKYVIKKPILDMDLLNKRVPVYAPNKLRAIMQYRCQFGDYAEVTGIANLLQQIEGLAHIHNRKK